MKTKTITSRSFGKRALMVLAVLFTALTASATEFITDVMLIGTSEKTDKDALISKYQNEGWTLIDKDLNAGCGSGSDYIYLLYKSEENTDGLNHGYITDFYIYGSQDSSFDDEVTSEECTYQLVSLDGSEKFKESKGDLNRGCGKGTDYIHLYYTKDPMGNKAVSKIEINNKQIKALGNMGMFGITGYNLNEGCRVGSENIYMHITKEKASTVKYIDYTYDTTNGLKSETKTCGRSKLVTNDDNSWISGWYVVSGNVEFSDRIKVSGTVNLILCDGCTLEAKKGIEVKNGYTLNIFAQSEGDKAGVLKAIATNEYDAAGIGGGGYVSGGTVAIYGGAVEAHGGEYGAGIGGGLMADGVTVTIYGGTVEAYGGYGAAGIGGGSESDNGTVTIYGGAVEAHGGDSGAGIGGGRNGSGGTVTIYGGAVVAQGGENGAGIGGGREGPGGTVTIYDGTVEANGGDKAAGIDAGYYGRSHGTLKIGDGVAVFGGGSKNPTTAIATGPQEDVGNRNRYMIVTPPRAGDANGDKKVNAADVVTVVNKINGKKPQPFYLNFADMNNNQKVDETDLQMLVNKIMK